MMPNAEETLNKSSSRAPQGRGDPAYPMQRAVLLGCFVAAILAMPRRRTNQRCLKKPLVSPTVNRVAGQVGMNRSDFTQRVREPLRGSPTGASRVETRPTGGGHRPYFSPTKQSKWAGLPASPLSRSRGFSIITAIFLLVVLSFLGVAMVTFSTTQHQSSAMDVMGSRAYQAARAGIC